MKTSSKFKIPITIAVCLVVGSLSGYVTADSISGWYNTLEKPFFNPPNWIFGPVWTVLYILMGISAGLVWKSEVANSIKKKALLIFTFQLIANAAWSILFFSLQSPILAFVDILILLTLIIYTIKLFKPIHKTASTLLIPYLLWVSFATILNLAIVFLNS